MSSFVCGEKTFNIIYNGLNKYVVNNSFTFNQINEEMAQGGFKITKRFANEEQATEFLKEFRLYDIYKKSEVTTEKRPFLIWSNTQTNEKSIEYLD